MASSRRSTLSAGRASGTDQSPAAGFIPNARIRRPRVTIGLYLRLFLIAVPIHTITSCWSPALRRDAAMIAADARFRALGRSAVAS